MSQMQNITEVEQNAELICEDLTVFGNVHEESIIDAHKLFVKGTVYPNSSQFAKYADISEHQGILRCHEAKIKTLNGGEVHASSITVDHCNGGSLYAQDVTINSISSDLKIFASNSITINTINGFHNELNINYKNVPILLSKLELIEEDIEELQFLLQDSKEKNSSSQKHIENEIQRLHLQYNKIKHSSLFAKISIHEIIQANNSISFEVDNHKLTYTTTNQRYTPFYIEITDTSITLLPTQTIIKL